MNLPDMTDEQLVAWDRDVAPFLPEVPVKVVCDNNRDIDIQYVPYPDHANEFHRPSLYGNTGRDFIRWFSDRWMMLLTHNGWTWLPECDFSQLWSNRNTKDSRFPR